MSALDAPLVSSEGRFDEAAYLNLMDNLEGKARWELIDGIPIEMPPATLRHARIAANLERRLNEAFASTGLTHLEALREAALRHPFDREFRPVADVAVFDPNEIVNDPEDRFFDRCFFVAEVLSPSTAHYDLVWKLPRYRQWPDCLHVLLLSQAGAEGRLWSRSRDWVELPLTQEDKVELPEFGFSCRLGDLYKGTPVR